MTTSLFQMTDTEIKAALKADGMKRTTLKHIVFFRRDQERIAALSARDLTGMTLEQEQESARAIDAQYPALTENDVIFYDIDGKLINFVNAIGSMSRPFVLEGLGGEYVSRLLANGWIEIINEHEDVTSYKLTLAGIKYAELRS